LPEAKSISQSYGTAIHAALDYAQILQNRDSYDIDLIFHKFEESLASEHMPANEFERFFAQGQSVLWTLLETYQYQLPKGSSPEQSLSVVLQGGAQLGGKLDRIDTQDKSHLVIVDYKTSF
jgi:hypothetical protein